MTLIQNDKTKIFYLELWYAWDIWNDTTKFNHVKHVKHENCNFVIQWLVQTYNQNVNLYNYVRCAIHKRTWRSLNMHGQLCMKYGAWHKGPYAIYKEICMEHIIWKCNAFYNVQRYIITSIWGKHKEAQTSSIRIVSYNVSQHDIIEYSIVTCHDQMTWRDMCMYDDIIDDKWKIRVCIFTFYKNHMGFHCLLMTNISTHLLKSKDKNRKETGCNILFLLKKEWSIF